MHQISVLVVVCLAAASNAAILTRDSASSLLEDGEWLANVGQKRRVVQDRSLDLMDADHRPVEAAFVSVVYGLDGLGNNLKAFLTQLQVVAEEFNEKYYGALIPIVEGIPAETMKEGLIKIMKAVSTVLEKLSVLIIDRNPLHPKLSTLDILGRELADEFRQSEEIMTLTVFGQRVGGLIGAVDDFLVNIVAQLAGKINEADVQLQDGIRQLEAIPPQMLKNVVLQAFRMSAAQ